MGSSHAAGRRQVIRSAVETLEFRRLFATFTVTNVSDSGAGSLRDAITLANADADADVIAFNIPGDGVQTIRPLTPLPAIKNRVEIDGYTQPGAKPNTLAVGDDRVLLVELNGGLLTASGPGLLFTESGPGFNSGGSSVRGLAINSGFSQGIRITSGGSYYLDNVTVAGNFIGTNAAGNALGDYMATGINVSGFLTDGHHIGGTSPADRNVVGGGTQNIVIAGGSNDNVVENNYIGVSADGFTSLQDGSFDNGILLNTTKRNTIGGTTAASRNVIVASGTAISMSETTRTRVIGNVIGLAADGLTLPINAVRGRAGVGVFNANTFNSVGGNSASEGNVIAHVGLGVSGSAANVTDLAIRRNSIFDTTKPISLGSEDYDINDPDDLDTGANRGQNFAAILSADATAGGTKVKAFLNTEPARGYVIDFFASPNTGDPTKQQAKTWLGSTQVTTDVYGNASFTADLPAAAPGTYITNTVTTLSTFPYGNTSQVSPAVIVEAVEPPLPPTPVELPKLSVADVSVTEGNSGTKTLTFTVKLSAAATTAVSVLYATQDGTAKTSDNDYTAKNGTLNFAIGETSKTVSVTIKGDTKSEIDESLKLLMSSASGATIADGSAVGTIKNDDAAPAKPKLSVGGYTAAEGHSGTKAFSFKVTLDKSGTSPITVKYSTLDDSAKAGSDYTSLSGTLTFAAGETSKIVTVYVKGDKAKEGDEKFYLVLSSPTNATIAVGKGTGLIKNDD